MKKYFFLFLFSLPVYSFYIEPFIGYSVSGSSHLSTWSTAAEKASMSQSFNATTFGMKSYVAILFTLLVGWDIQFQPYLIWNRADDSISRTHFARLMTGPIIGLQFPVFPIRFWVGLHFIDLLNAKHYSSLQGGSYKLGASLYILPFLNINLEYIHSVFLNINGLKTILKGYLLHPTKGTALVDTLQFSISVPFNI